MIDRPVKREKIHPPAIYVGNPTSPTLTSHRPRLLSNSPYSHPRFPQQVVEKSKTEDMEKKGKGKKGKIYKESDPSFVTRPQNAPKNPKHDRKENAKRRKKPHRYVILYKDCREPTHWITTPTVPSRPLPAQPRPPAMAARSLVAHPTWLSTQG